ncbi:MAG: acyloxyacyl hydrolase [Ignavibacteria bacterium]
MKTLLILILLLPMLTTSAQRIGELAPEKLPETFPVNSWGIDFMFGEGGFGLGTFYRYNFTTALTGFTDFSVSESKDEKEVEYFDYFGNSTVIGKKNRIFLMPLNFGLQQRLLENSVTDNLRPYINAGIGPSMVVTTPYDYEFFSSFKKAQARFTLGGYFGIGANFGPDKANLLGLNLRYYIIHFFNNGVEGLKNRYMNDLGGFYLTLNLGIMY